MKKIKAFIKRFLKNTVDDQIELTTEQKISKYLNSEKIPWSYGYHEYKWQQIQETLLNSNLLFNFKNIGKLANHGIGIDERIIEYPWIISNLSNLNTKFLDAGSTFNFEVLLNHPLIIQKQKTIITYHPEHPNFNHLKVNYIYSDLRDIPIKSEYFEEIVCHSTLEHIDMDNSIYGYKATIKEHSEGINYEYLSVIKELLRILKYGGILLITVPYGRFENHGFFQQFNSEMISRIEKEFSENGTFEKYFFKYQISGWEYSNKEDCANCESFNPHTGIGKKDDNAAHSRAICCLKFTKTSKHIV